MANKTKVPGMENDYASNYEEGMSEQTSNANERQFYTNGTYIPGMEGMNNKEKASNRQEKPVIGFLYSISRKPSGEFWPLHLGPNTIGRSNKCDVILNEGTVSDEHAILVLRQMKNPQCLIASITDSKSTCGTMINGNSLSFEANECKNSDIITIGENYELLFILIDAKKMGLTTSDSFIETAPASKPQKTDIGSEPSFGPRSPLSQGVRVQAGTVSLDGNGPTSPGGTRAK